MIGDGEAVRFVADALDEVEALRAPVKADGVARVDDEQLLLAFGQAGQGDVVHPQVAQLIMSGRELALASIDDDEIGQGLPALLGAHGDGGILGGLRRLLPAVVLDGRSFCFGADVLDPKFVRDLTLLGRRGLLVPLRLALLGQAREASSQYLGHRGKVVRSFHGPDLEATILARRGLSVDEDDHAGDRI